MFLVLCIIFGFIFVGAILSFLFNSEVIAQCAGICVFGVLAIFAITLFF